MESGKEKGFSIEIFAMIKTNQIGATNVRKCPNNKANIIWSTDVGWIERRIRNWKYKELRIEGYKGDKMNVSKLKPHFPKETKTKKVTHEIKKQI